MKPRWRRLAWGAFALAAVAAAGQSAIIAWHQVRSHYVLADSWSRVELTWPLTAVLLGTLAWSLLADFPPEGSQGRLIAAAAAGLVLASAFAYAAWTLWAPAPYVYPYEDPPFAWVAGGQPLAAPLLVAAGLDSLRGAPRRGLSLLLIGAGLVAQPFHYGEPVSLVWAVGLVAGGGILAFVLPSHARGDQRTKGAVLVCGVVGVAWSLLVPGLLFAVARMTEPAHHEAARLFPLVALAMGALGFAAYRTALRLFARGPALGVDARLG